MNKKVLIISSSPRKGGNSETLVAAFAKGAREAGNQVETVYLLATAAENAPETFAGTEKAVQGWVDCFPRCALVGTVFAGGVNGAGEIAGHPALEQAYQMGKEV